MDPGILNKTYFYDEKTLINNTYKYISIIRKLNFLFYILRVNTIFITNI